MDGNEACSYVSYKFIELAGIYPITPASPMAENIDKYSSLLIISIKPSLSGFVLEAHTVFKKY